MKGFLSGSSTEHPTEDVVAYFNRSWPANLSRCSISTFAAPPAGAGDGLPGGRMAGLPLEGRRAPLRDAGEDRQRRQLDDDRADTSWQVMATSLRKESVRWHDGST